MDSNHRPHAYQACALTSWAISPFLKSFDSIRICLMQSSLSPRNKFLGHGNPHMRPHLLLYPEASFQQPFSQTCALTLVTRIFWWRCTCGKHPFPSRTRRLRRKRPMVLHWRRCGRAGGRQIKKKATDRCLMDIEAGFTSDIRRKRFFLLYDW